MKKKQENAGNPGAADGSLEPISEDRLLADFVLWAWNTYPLARRCWWHVPNELERPRGEPLQHFRRRLAKAKAKGTVKGVVDLHGVFGGQFWTIEVKVDGGVVSDDQAKFQAAIRAQGALVFTVWSIDELKEKFEWLYKWFWK